MAKKLEPVTKSQNLYQWRVQIWEETFTMRDDFPKAPSEKICYDARYTITKQYEHTIYSVENMDTIVAGEYMKSKGLNPLVLNFADDNHPGGSVDTGSGAQEESLFRRTNYCATLTEKFYPIWPSEAIYSPVVTVFRDTEDKNNRFLRKPFQLAFIAAPGIFNPPLTREKRLSDSHANLLKRKIEIIFQVAHKKGHDSLVLGALGCGAWRNPPRHVAEIFKEMVHKYDGVFKDIIFACIDVGDAKTSNYRIFREILMDD